MPGLQLQLRLPLASTQPSYLGSQVASDAKAQVVAELEIMREDVRTLELALAKVSKQMKTETDPFGGTQPEAGGPQPISSECHGGSPLAAGLAPTGVDGKPSGAVGGK